MAVTDFQRGVCRLLAMDRIRRGESYVAGGVALNTVATSTRISRDIDLFHDSDEALSASWKADRQLLESSGYTVSVHRELPALVEAVASTGKESVLIQWARDSAFRFFPLVEHEDFGLTLHPFDLAANKVLALVGRLEARDWIDVIHSHERIQPLGYVAWAACGKDPGLSPAFILEEARRTGRYAVVELNSLEFTGPPPEPAALSRKWREILKEAGRLISLLPYAQAGKCVLDAEGRLFRGGEADLARALESGGVRFHPGSIGGSFPRVTPVGP
jgi:hypothetical protein